MRKKNIVFFTGKQRASKDPFIGFGKKRSVYYSFFERGTELGHNIFLANGKHTHIKDDSFKDVLFFDGEKFISHSGLVKADAVLDRSALKYFPTELSRVTLNNRKFKDLCASKLRMDDLLGEYMPHTHRFSNPDSFPKDTSSTKYVLKPASGLGGKGIFFGTCSELVKKYRKLYIAGTGDYLLQEFIETSPGIKGIVEGRHDMRVVLIGGAIVWITVRTPAKGSLCANVAQGGAIRDVTNLKIPKEIQETIRKVVSSIEHEYGKRLVYSIDFGVADKRVVVFEINDQIGFPNENMSSSVVFIESLLQELIKISAER